MSRGGRGPDGGSGSEPPSPAPPPPRILALLSRLVLPARDREFIVGDLEEMHARRCARVGRARAALGYLRDATASAATGWLAPWRREPGGARARIPGGPGPRLGGQRGVSSGDLLAEVRIALRTLLRHQRGFTLVTVLTLALGVGATAAVFGMVNQILLRSLPGVAHARDAAYLQFGTLDDPTRLQAHAIAAMDFDELRREVTLLDGIGSYRYVILTVSVDGERPLQAYGSVVYGDYFEALRAWPVAGRLLTAGETGLDADDARVVLGQRLSERLFGSPSAAVGRTVRMNGHDITVVGVAGGGLRGAERGGTDVEVWLPFGALTSVAGFDRETLLARSSTTLAHFVVRPRRGVGLDAVREQIGTVFGRLAHADTESAAYLRGLRPMLFPGLDTPPNIRSSTRRTLRLLAGVVALVLLVACANVANLLLFRNMEARGALAARRALGASPVRIAGQQILQSLLLGALGTAAGVGTGWIIAEAFRGSRITGMPAFDGLAMDGHVAAFAGVASVATALLFGAVPAVLAGRFDLAASLRQTGGRDTGRGARLRSALAALQLASSLSLVVGALLLMHTVHNLYAADLGVDVGDVYEITLPTDRDLPEADVDALYRSVLGGVTSVPGVQAAAVSTDGLPVGLIRGRVGRTDAPSEDLSSAGMILVTHGWLDVFRVPLVSGHAFREADWKAGAPDRTILTASLARRIFGSTDVVGRTVLAGDDTPHAMEVVGVTRDIRSAYAPDRTVDAFLVPYGTAPHFDFFTLLVRATRPDPGVAHRIRTAVEDALPGQPVPDPSLLTAGIDDIRAECTLFTHLLELLSALAVTLSGVGLYGVVAFTVAGRRRELGVRVALGAARSRIVVLVVRQAASVVASGTVLGLGGAYALSRVLRSRLFGVEPVDPLSYAAAAAVFAVVTAAACWIPAQRALKLDPAATLREE